MQSTLWQYKHGDPETMEALVGYHADSLSQLMGTSNEEGLHLHLIEQSADKSWLTGKLRENHASKKLLMNLDSRFMLEPVDMPELSLPGMLRNPITRIKLDDEVQLCFETDPRSEFEEVHVVYPLYRIALEKAADRKSYVLVYVRGPLAIVLFFLDGACQLANIYPVENESEALYFALAPLRKSGAALNETFLEILSSSDQAKGLLDTFQKFIPKAELIKFDLPYESDEYPPHAAEAWLLHYLCQCELPVVI